MLKLSKVLCCMFLFSILALTKCTNHNSCLLLTEELTNRNVSVTYFMHNACMSAKQKIVHSRGRLKSLFTPSCLPSFIASPLC